MKRYNTFQKTGLVKKDAVVSPRQKCKASKPWVNSKSSGNEVVKSTFSEEEEE